MVVYVTILQYRICTNFDYQEYEYLRDIAAEIHVSFEEKYMDELVIFLHLFS